jgi:hypothetical protein
MNETRFDPAAKIEQEKPTFRTIEPDWTESEWFQIWLKLARHSFSDDPTVQRAH